MNATVRVQLLGRDYLLRSQGDPERVREAALLVEEKLAGMAEALSVDTRDRFILALLNLAGEYLFERRRSQAVEEELELLKARQDETDEQLRRAAGLVERIEEALDATAPGDGNNPDCFGAGR